MRVLTPVIGVLLFSVSLAAQAPEPAPGPLDRGTMGLPLPSIGLPHPPTGLPPERSPVQKGHVGAPRREPGHRQRPRPVVPMYRWPHGWLVLGPRTPVTPPPGPDSATAGSEVSAARPGRLRVFVQPRVIQQQVYVDGYYVGDVDAAREGFEVEAGTHTLEIRADGYETLEVPVQLEAGRSISYRGRLSPASRARAPEPESAATTAGAITFYVIPGCYMGNVPPEDAGLPSSCDLTKAIAVKP